MTLTEFLMENYKNRADGTGMSDAEFRNFIIEYLLPDGWCVTDPVGQSKINEIALYEILEMYSARFRKERQRIEP